MASPPAPPSAEHVSATLHTVAITVQRLRLRGIAASAALRHSGVTETMLSQPAELITRAQENTIFATALQCSGDATLGLEIGAAMHMPSYGILGYTMMICPSLRRALQCTLDYPTLLGSYFDLGVEVRTDWAWMTVGGYHYRADMEVFNTDMCVASLWALVCDVLGARRAPLALRFAFGPPAHAAAYTQVLGCAPEFDAGETAFAFPAAWLDQPLPLAEPVSCHMALAQCEQLEREWSRAAGDGLMARVLRLLYADPRRYANLETLAEALCLSGRTLRRRLQTSGTSFQVLRDQALRERALEYLHKTPLPIAHISDLLGYSEPASFRQAFRRWTGKSPSELRRK